MGPIHGLVNARDLGGIACAGGTVRSGLVVRTGAPAEPSHATALAALGPAHVVDLRSRLEREGQPAVLPAGVTTVVADVLADAAYSGAANLGQLAAKAMGGEDVLGRLAGRDLRPIMLASYRDFAQLPSARRATADVVRLLATPRSGPVIIHCTAGKDRTGWLVAVILHLLGATWDDIMADYLLSGPAMQQAFAAYYEALPDPEAAARALAPVLGVFPDYLEAAMESARMSYGSFDAYVREGLAIDDETLTALRSQLVQSRSASALT